MKNFVLRALIVLLFLPLFGHASGVEHFKSYFKNISSMRADFHQVVTDKQGNVLQTSDGKMQLQRPGLFRWDYNAPNKQQIVGDGQKIWLYDIDLNQVTVRDMAKAVGGTPAALLAGNNDVEKYFKLKDTSRKGDLEWVLATSKDKEGEFDRVFFGFNGDELAEMELHDNFGNRTNIIFSHFERNPKLTTASFLFKPPQGADVVGE